MEPASLDSTKAHEGKSHAGREGSLENPELVENVPGHVIPILRREFDDFDTESTRFLKGELEGDEFISSASSRASTASASRTRRWSA